MSHLMLFLLGPPRVERDGVPVRFDRRKATALLAYLAVTRRPHQRDALAALFWPELDQSRARAALRRTLVAIRQGIDDGWLDADRETAGLHRDCDLWVDVARFEALLAACQAHDHPQGRLCASCLAALSEAVALYRGDFMAGFTLRDSADMDDWQREQGEDLRRELIVALEKLVRAYAAQGDLGAAIDAARRWLAIEPLHEEAHRHLMQLYAREGQRSAALEQYRACREVLERELGLSPAQETIQLYQDIRERRPLPASPAQAAPPSNLPQQATRFVGRRSELAAIARRLADDTCRLLTLVGPGGIGKTRLALQAAAGQSACFAHGTYYVPLTSVRSADLLVPAVANAIGFAFGDQEDREPESPLGRVDRTPRGQLLHHLWNKEMLLVLDNMEHLIEGAELLAAMLSAAPRLKLLVTSRQRLNLSGEWPFEVRGLQVPDTEGPAEEVESSDAAQLFLGAARRIHAAFTAKAGDLIRICRSLEGIPLAIEITAAWAHTLSCSEIAAEVDRAMAGANLDFFAAHLRDVPPRHRSMRAVFEHSWSLLSTGEQAALAAMAVFRGGFDRDAVAQVTGTPLAVLSALVDKSLVRRIPDRGQDGGSRYDLHELLRQYAEERLGTETPFRDRHCRYYAAFLNQREVSLRGVGQGQALAEIEREIDNVRAAWQWATSQGRWHEIDQALDSLHVYYEVRSRYREGSAALEQAAAALEAGGGPDPLPYGRLLAHLGRLTFGLDELEAARSTLEQSLAILRPLPAPGEVARALMWLSDVAGRQQERQRAGSLLRESLAISREIGDRHLEAEGLRGLAAWTASESSPRARAEAAAAEAHDLYRHSLAIFRELGDRLGIASALYGLARVTDRLGQPEETRQLLEESLAIRRELGDRRGTAWCLHFLAECARGESRYAESRQLYEQGLAIHRELGDPLRTWNALQRMSTVVYRLGDLAAFEEISQEIHVLALRIGNRFAIACALEGLGEVAHVKGEYARAREYYQESLRIGYEIEHPRAITWSLMGLGDADYETGQYAAARTRYEQSLAICLGSLKEAEEQVEDGIPMSLVRLGNAARAVEDYAASREYYTRALRFEIDRNYPGAIVHVLSNVAPLLAQEGRIEDALALCAFLLLRPEVWWPDRDEVQKLLDEWTVGLAAGAAAAARERGAAWTLEEACDRVLALPSSKEASDEAAKEKVPATG